jgi:hypothetical protein
MCTALAVVLHRQAHCHPDRGEDRLHRLAEVVLRQQGYPPWPRHPSDVVQCQNAQKVSRVLPLRLRSQVPPRGQILPRGRDDLNGVNIFGVSLDDGVSVEVLPVDDEVFFVLRSD